MTPRSTERQIIDGPAGALEVVVNAPSAAPAGIVLVAHPLPTDGGTLDNKVVYTLAKTFFALGYVAVRFNFRGVGASVGTFDEGRGETDDALATLAYARARYGDGLPIALAGFSFGTFVQTRVAHQVQVQRLVLIAPAVNRFPIEHVPHDTIVVHGDVDDVVPLSDVLAWARPQSLAVIVFTNCGHFFHGRLPDLQRVVTAQWRDSEKA